jgi:hypothetical protein
MFRLSFALSLALSVLREANGFVAPSRAVPAAGAVRRTAGTGLHSDSTGWDSFRDFKDIKDISYGEEARKYRRTVYSHDDWKKHRSPDRFVYYLAAIFNSGVYKTLGREVTATTAIATFVCLYNAVTQGWVDLAGAQHGGLIVSEFLPKLGLPLTPFTLASPSLGLLLGMFSWIAEMNVRMVKALDSTDTRASALQSFEQTPRTNVGTKPGRTGE